MSGWTWRACSRRDRKRRRPAGRGRSRSMGRRSSRIAPSRRATNCSSRDRSDARNGSSCGRSPMRTCPGPTRGGSTTTSRLRRRRRKSNSDGSSASSAPPSRLGHRTNGSGGCAGVLPVRTEPPRGNHTGHEGHKSTSRVRDNIDYREDGAHRAQKVFPGHLRRLGGKAPILKCALSLCDLRGLCGSAMLTTPRSSQPDGFVVQWRRNRPAMPLPMRLKKRPGPPEASCWVPRWIVHGCDGMSSPALKYSR
jgi:hypothetical protein